MDDKKQRYYLLYKLLVILISLFLLGCSNKNIVDVNKPTTSIDENESIESFLDENYIKIIGIWEHEDGTKYEFNKDYTGGMYVGNYKYNFTYKCYDNTIYIDYLDSEVHDSDYEYELEDGMMRLKGGKGTDGGKYILKR